MLLDLLEEAVGLGVQTSSVERQHPERVAAAVGVLEQEHILGTAERDRERATADLERARDDALGRSVDELGRERVHGGVRLVGVARFGRCARMPVRASARVAAAARRSVARALAHALHPDRFTRAKTPLEREPAPPSSAECGPNAARMPMVGRARAVR